ncbi:MAG: M23 family metallopeptidase [bacterium]|nr:M23 family metallopeptidase [bacterium]
MGSYGGHWGIDYDVALGTPVGAAGAGTVTFVGSVAGMLAVTLDHGGGLKTSYSYLSSVDVGVGSRIASGDTIGRSGLHHTIEALHFSTRLDGTYQDPRRWLRCLKSPSAALRLSSAYPFGRATWHPRRDVRPPTFRTPFYGRGCLLAAGARRCHFHAGRSTVAEVRFLGQPSPAPPPDDPPRHRRRSLLRG